jgi:hypothetical protein
MFYGRFGLRITVVAQAKCVSLSVKVILRLSTLRIGVII